MTLIRLIVAIIILILYMLICALIMTWASKEKDSLSVKFIAIIWASIHALLFIFFMIYIS